MCTHICSKTEDAGSLMRIGNRNLELGHHPLGSPGGASRLSGPNAHGEPCSLRNSSTTAPDFWMSNPTKPHVS